MQTSGDKKQNAVGCAVLVAVYSHFPFPRIMQELICCVSVKQYPVHVSPFVLSLWLEANAKHALLPRNMPCFRR